AMTAGLVIPESKRPVKVLLRAAHVMKWWQVHERLSAELNDPAERALWRGLAACAHNGFDAASEAFAEAGALGAPWAAALDEARQIKSALVSENQEVRARAIVDWEQWQANLPGEIAWRDEPQTVVEYAGAETMYTIARDAYSRVFRATVERPVRMRFLGPVRVLFDMRPLHPVDGAGTPLDGWIAVDDGALTRIPFTNNLPADGLTVIDAPWIPGTKVSRERAFGPGLHEVAVWSDEAPLLVRVYVARPEIPLGVLPPLTQDTFRAAWQGQYAPSGGNPPPSVIPAKAGIQDECAGSSCPDWVPAFAGMTDDGAGSQTSSGDGSGRTHQLFILSPLDAVKLGMTTEVERLAWSVPNNGSDRSDRSVGSDAVSVAEIETALAAFRPPGETAPDTEQAWPLAERDPALALASHGIVSDSGAVPRMELLVWIAERFPEHRLQAIVEAESLNQAYPGIPELRPLTVRLMQYTDWAPLENVMGGAGFRMMPMTGWQPESPALRVRKALVPPVSTDALLVAQDRETALSLLNLEPTVIDAALTMRWPEYTYAGPVTVGWQVDEIPPASMVLTPESPAETLHIALGTGEHSLRFRVEKPLANQLVFLQTRETRANGEQVPLERALERKYDVATPGEPLHVMAEGPALIRVDSLYDGQLFTEYREIPAGWQEFDLTPPAGAPETLYRLRKRVIVPPRETTPVWRVAAVSEPVPEPEIKVTVTSPDPLDGIGEQDSLHGGDGTWQLRSGLVRRTSADEDGTERVPEQFWEWGITHRRFGALERTHFQTDVLARLHENGGPVLGIRESVSYYPDHLPFTLRLDGNAFVQEVESGETEWSAGLEGQVFARRDINLKTYHLPSLSVFVRDLSMDTNRRESSLVLDMIYGQLMTRFRNEIYAVDYFGNPPFNALNDLAAWGINKAVNDFVDPLYYGAT
ncbi:MAG: hypothetical protein QG656_1673, partial [Candidatus Hydrogenedentes bacterium]|nr:hypothetical protein [Candidatus Hydrogenedentota bacterium]